MDFKGQELAEQLFYWIIIIFSAIGWIYGYFQQDFTYVFQAWLVGLVISVVLCVPDWPIYNRHPVKYLDSVQEKSQQKLRQQQQQQTAKTTTAESS